MDLNDKSKQVLADLKANGGAGLVAVGSFTGLRDKGLVIKSTAPGARGKVAVVLTEAGKKAV